MSAPVPVLGYEHTGLLARDPESLSAWYVRMFGGRVVSRSEDSPAIVFVVFGRSSLLEFVPAGDSPHGEANDHAHFSFAVSSLESAVRSLEGEEIALDRPVFQAYDGSPVAFFRDPEGNLVQLVERRSDLEPPWRG